MATADVLITGISGFIASNLARSLTAENVEVVGIGRTEPSSDTMRSGVRFVPCDVTDANQVLAVCSSIQPHTVYHLAAHSVLTGSTAAEMIRTNVVGTLNVLEACRAVTVPVCIVASSDKQYGALAAPPYLDDDTTAFRNGGVYELSKAQQDQTARLFAGLYESPAVRVARLVNIFGAGDAHWTRIVPGTILRSVNREAARITSGKAGKALREYLYIADAVAALRLLAADAAMGGNESYRTPGGKMAPVAFNIAGGAKLAAAEVVDKVRTVLREDFGIVSPEPVVQSGATNVFEPGSQFNDASKIAELFRRHGQVYSSRPFREGLRDTIPWYLTYLKNGG